MSDSDETMPQDIVDTTKIVSLDLFPAKTRASYERMYTTFIKWRKEKKIKSFSENTLLAYFNELSKTYRSSSLWAKYSMLRLTLNAKHNIDISQYDKVRGLLKQLGTGYKAKQSKIYSSENVQEFLNKAPDNKYLATKVALIFGIVGGCGREDLRSIEINHIEDTGFLAVVNLPRTNKRMSRTFVIQDEYYEIYKKYSALRPKDTILDNFFLNYQNGACTKQVIGVNKFGGMPSQIAEFLQLPNPKDYTGYCFQRTSAFLSTGSKRSRKRCSIRLPQKLMENEVQLKLGNNDGCEFNSETTKEEEFDNSCNPMITNDFPMVSSRIELLNRNNICRACLTEESTFQSVFQTENNSGLLMPISEMMSACATIQVTEGDGLPEKICSECAEVTVKTYLFKLKCEKSDMILRARLKKVPLCYEENSINEGQKIKVEPDENEKIAENKEIKEFECDICLEKFSRENVLKDHKLTHAMEIEELEIKQEKPFEINDILNSALELEIKESIFSCPECDFVFFKKEDLGNHIISFHNQKQSEMSSLKNFKTEDQLIYSESNLNSGPLNCDVCFEGFDHISNLNDHMKTHNDENTLICSTSSHTGNQSFTNSDFCIDQETIDYEASDSDENTSQDQDIVETTTNVTLDLFPAKTRVSYERVYKTFMNWRKEKKIKSFSENTLLAYFNELSKTYRSSSLWAKYSMLRLTLITKNNIDISQYEKVKTLLKRMATGYKAKQSKIYSSENVQEFLNNAPDNKYLATKVALIFGIVGGCGREELHSIKINHIEDTGSLAVVNLPRMNKRMSRTFVIQDEYYGFYKKYSALRPKDVIFNNFFLNYQNGACTKQVIGVNKFGGMPSQIAEFLQLPNPKDYTGYCFRRTSVFLRAGLKRSRRRSSIRLPQKIKENEVPIKLDNDNNY